MFVWALFRAQSVWSPDTTPGLLDLIQSPSSRILTKYPEVAARDHTVSAIDRCHSTTCRRVNIRLPCKRDTNEWCLPRQQLWIKGQTHVRRYRPNNLATLWTMAKSDSFRRARTSNLQCGIRPECQIFDSRRWDCRQVAANGKIEGPVRHYCVIPSDSVSGRSERYDVSKRRSQAYVPICRVGKWRNSSLWSIVRRIRQV